MKISRLEIFEFKASQRGNWIFIRVSTKEGLTGLGEASQSGNNAIVRVALRECFQRIRGEDAAEVERLWTRMAGSTDVFSGVMGRAEATALSAFDQALWDIRGKMLRGAGLAALGRALPGPDSTLRQPEPRHDRSQPSRICPGRFQGCRSRFFGSQKHPFR